MGNYYSIDYEIDETEAIAVRMIFKEYINGTGYIAICRMLNERGFKTRRGNDFSKGSLYEIITKGADKCSNSSLSADKVEKIIADFIRDFYLDETMLDNLVNIVMINHNKSRQEKQKELNAIIAKKNGIQHKIQNFFSFIESVGTVDDMQKARYQALKEELEAVEKSIAKTKKEVSVTDTPDKSFIKNFILAHSHIDTIEELEKLAPLFVEKIIVDKSEIYVTFKLELVGALGGNRTHAFSSGG